MAYHGAWALQTGCVLGLFAQSPVLLFLRGPLCVAFLLLLFKKRRNHFLTSRPDVDHVVVLRAIFTPSSPCYPFPDASANVHASHLSARPSCVSSPTAQARNLLKQEAGASGEWGGESLGSI